MSSTGFGGASGFAPGLGKITMTAGPVFGGFVGVARLRGPPGSGSGTAVSFCGFGGGVAGALPAKAADDAAKRTKQKQAARGGEGFIVSS
jgi:hypothetical protein